MGRHPNVAWLVAWLDERERGLVPGSDFYHSFDGLVEALPGNPVHVAHVARVGEQLRFRAHDHPTRGGFDLHDVERPPGLTLSAFYGCESQSLALSDGEMVHARVAAH